jgi:hypothetical protein
MAGESCLKDPLECSPTTSNLFGVKSSHTEESDRSGISEDTQLGELKCKALILKNDARSPDKSMKSKYYKKYIHYKGLTKEIQTQLHETKDRAIASLVEKEKSFIKQKHELSSIIKEQKRNIQKLENNIDNSKTSPLKKGSQFNIVEGDDSDGFSSRIIESKETYLKQKLDDIKAERNNTVKKLNLDFQALMGKYEDDVAYYKEMVDTLPRNSVHITDDSTPKHDLNIKIIEELKENEAHYLEQQQIYKKKISELQARIVEYAEIIDDKQILRAGMNAEFDDHEIEELNLKLRACNEQINKLKYLLEQKETE